MGYLDSNLSPIIESLFPERFREDGPNLVALIKAYYEWMELEGNPLYLSKKIPEHSDIDTTLDDFFVYFKEKYLKNVQFETESNKKLFIKNSLDFYRSKGTERSIDLFFKLIYGEDADVYYPGDDIFRLSAGNWVVPTYLEVTKADKNNEIVNKQIRGVNSGATAFVERLVRRKVNGRFIDIFYISSLNGNFETNEIITHNDETEGMPRIIGSLSRLEIVSGGDGFNIGDIIEIIDGSGSQGKARVTDITDTNGLVEFELIDGGWGYASNASVYISEKILSLTSYSGNTDSPFIGMEYVDQPIHTISYSPNNPLVNGENVFTYHGNGSVSASAKVISSSGNVVSNSGTVLLYPLSGNVGACSVFRTSGNVYSFNMDAWENDTATFQYLASSNSLVISANNWNMIPFIIGETVSQGNNSGRLTQAFYESNNAVLYISDTNRMFDNSSIIGLTSNGSADVNAISLSIGVINIGINPVIVSDIVPIIGRSSNNRAFVSSISSGSQVNFTIGEMENIETVIFGTDKLGDNNTQGVPFMNIRLNGNNSTVPGGGYGFPKFSNGGPNTQMGALFGFSSMDIGTIASLSGINPGVDYTNDPFVIIKQEEIIPYNKRDYNVSISNPTGNFYVGEIVEHSINEPAVILNVNGVTGSFHPNDVITQGGVSGIAYSVDIGNGIIRVRNITGGSFAPGAISGYSGTANIVSSVSTGHLVRTRGIILQGSDQNNLILRRISWSDEWVIGDTLMGISSGSIATILSSSEIESNISGNNAIVSANVQIANGNITNVEVIDSGFGYANSEMVLFTSENKERNGAAKIVLEKQGVSEGYFRGTDSFLSDGKYLHDGEYYQEYSYEIRSKLPLDRYIDMAKKVLHVAGTRMFGAVHTSSIEPSLIIPDSNTSDIYNLKVCGGINNNHSIIPGYRLMDEEGVEGIISSYQTTITVPGSNSPFYEIGNRVHQPNTSINSASGNLLRAVSDIVSNTTTLYLNNVSGLFVPSVNAYGYNRRQKNIEPVICAKLGTVLSPNTITKSFQFGETVSQGGASGSVIAANSSHLKIKWAAGTFSSGNISGSLSGAQASITEVTNTQFTPGQEIRQDIIRITTESIEDEFIFGETVYSYIRNPDNSTQFMNTAIGRIIDITNNAIYVDKTFGRWNPRETITGESSNARASIAGVDTINIVRGIVTSSNNTALIVQNSSNSYITNSYVYSNTAMALLVSETANVSFMDSRNISEVINILTVQNTTGQFIPGNAYIVDSASETNIEVNICGVSLSG